MSSKRTPKSALNEAISEIKSVSILIIIIIALLFGVTLVSAAIALSRNMSRPVSMSAFIPIVAAFSVYLCIMAVLMWFLTQPKRLLKSKSPNTLLLAKPLVDRNGHMRYFNLILFGYFVLALTNGGLGWLASVTTAKISANQESIISAFTSQSTISLVLLVVYGCIFAPMLEELVFRGAFSYYIKNKWILYLMSSGAFGYLHMAGEKLSAGSVLNFLTYTVLGAILMTIAQYTGDLRSSMAVHAISNTLAYVPLLLLAFGLNYTIAMILGILLVWIFIMVALHYTSLKQALEIRRLSGQTD